MLKRVISFRQKYLGKVFYSHSAVSIQLVFTEIIWFLETQPTFTETIWLLENQLGFLCFQTWDIFMIMHNFYFIFQSLNTIQKASSELVHSKKLSKILEVSSSHVFLLFNAPYGFLLTKYSGTLLIQSTWTETHYR